MHTVQLCGTPPLTATTVPISLYTYSTYVHPEFFTAGGGSWIWGHIQFCVWF